jgi:hypothetical protein
MALIKKKFSTQTYNIIDTLPFRMGPFFTEQVRIATSNIDFYVQFSENLDDTVEAGTFDMIIPRNCVEMLPSIIGGFISVRPIDYTGDSTLPAGAISITEVDLLNNDSL